jgi:alpha-tubulin suppressor-like RCC1 family protein
MLGTLHDVLLTGIAQTGAAARSGARQQTPEDKMRFLSRCSRSSAPLVAAVPLFIAACGDGPAEPAPSVEQAVTAQTVAPPALVQVSAGAAHTCGITAAGQAWCWGHGTNGQLGNGERVDRLVPTPVSGSLLFRQISASWFHTCGVTTDNRIWC